MKQQFHSVNFFVFKIIVLTIFFSEFIVLGLATTAIYDSLSRADWTSAITVLISSLFFLISPIIMIPLFSPFLFITIYGIYLIFHGINKLWGGYIIDLSSIRRIGIKYFPIRREMIYKYFIFFLLTSISALIYYQIIINFIQWIYKYILPQSNMLRTDLNYGPHVLGILGLLGYIVFIVITLLVRFTLRIDFFKLPLYSWLTSIRLVPGNRNT